MSAAGQLARKIADQGWRGLLPLLPADVSSPVTAIEKGRGKTPGAWDEERAGWSLIRDWPNYPNDLDTIEKWSSWPGVNVGLRCCYGAAPLVAVFDTDVLHHEASEEILEFLRGRLNPRGEFLWRVGRSPKFAVPVQVTEPVRKARSVVVEIAGQKHMVELLGAGQQFVVAGIHPDTGREYSWPAGGLEFTEPGKLPLFTPAELAEILEECSKILLRYGPAVARQGRIRPESSKPRPIDELRALNPWEANSAAEFVINTDWTYDDWIAWAYVLRGAFGDDGEEIWLRFSEQSAKNDPDETAKVWAAVTKAEHDGQLRSGAGTIIDTARREGWTGDREAAAHGAEVFAEIAAAKKAKESGGGTAPPPESAPPPPPEPPTQEEVDAIVAGAGGLLGDLTQWMTETARYPQPLLSLGASLTTVGALMGHRYRLLDGPDTRSNCMILGLANSGSGKDHPRRCVVKALQAAGLERWYMGRSIASAPGIVGALASFHSGVMLLDEAGLFFASIMDPKAPPYLRAINSLLMELATSATTKFVDAARADNRDPNAVRYEIPDPCLNLFATTTPGPFWAALNSGAADSGFLARFLLLETSLNFPDPRFDAAPIEEGIPKLIGRMRQLVAGPGNEVTDLMISSCINALQPLWETSDTGKRTRKIHQPSPYIVPMTPEARAEDRRIALAELELKRAHEGQSHAASVLARTCEHSRQKALMRASSRNPFMPEIDSSDMRWGEAITMLSQRLMIPAIKRYIADTPWEAQLLKLLEIIRRHGDWIDTSTLGDRCYFMKPNDRRAAIGQMIESGRLEWREEKTATKPKISYRVRNGA